MSNPLIYKNEHGNAEGNDPRRVARPVLEGAFSNQNYSRAIRAKCLDCCCGQQGEVLRCTVVKCPLWPFRMGTNPFTNRKGGFKSQPPEAAE